MRISDWSSDVCSSDLSGIVDEQRYHGVAELHVSLCLEGQRMRRVGDDARQPPGVEQTFLQVELPGPRLLRHELALQPVRKLADDALQVNELLVEELAQPGQILRIAQNLRADDLVEALGVGFVEGLPRHVGRIMLRPPRSEEHTSELQSLMRTSYAVFCLQKKKPTHIIP